MSAVFWWTAWAASTSRPGTNVTYTQNWPHELLIGNQPTPGAMGWSVISFVLLLDHRAHVREGSWEEILEEVGAAR